MEWREKRRAEIRTMQKSHPAELIARFQQCTGLPVGAQLPRDISFRLMIEAILDYEERDQRPPERA
jgi:hypothetical protein